MTTNSTPQTPDITSAKTDSSQDNAVFRARDSRNPGWFWADNRIVSHYLPIIGVYAFSVYMYLCQQVSENLNNSEAEVSVGKMAGVLNVSKPTIRKAIECLEQNCLIKVERSRDPNNPDLNYVNRYTLGELGGSKSSYPPPSQSPLLRSQSGLLGVVNDVDPLKELEKEKKQEEDSANSLRSSQATPIKVDNLPSTTESGKPATPKTEKAKRPPQPHIAPIEAWFDGVGRDKIPADVSVGSFARHGKIMATSVAEGKLTLEELGCSGKLYRVWLDEVKVVPNWSVGAVITDMRSTLGLCRKGVTGNDVKRFIKARYEEEDNKGNQFWKGKVVSLDHIATHIGKWLEENKTGSSTIIENNLRWEPLLHRWVDQKSTPLDPAFFEKNRANYQYIEWDNDKKEWTINQAAIDERKRQLEERNRETEEANRRFKEEREGKWQR